MRCRHPMRFGASVETDGTRFRLWAPDARSVTLHIPGRTDIALARAQDGWMEAMVAGVGAGTRYGFRVGGRVIPDPVSRYQPDGVHALSEVVDPLAFRWPDDGWQGRPWEQAVIYEMHVGTFTPQGTFSAAMDHLDALADLGVTAIELMPLAQFPGNRGWGYDGVLPFAPHHSYGRPEDLKAFIAAAHARGLMVLLDVVYNHFGPEGNYLHLTARRFFTPRHHTPWGQAINFHDSDARPVRQFFMDNALYWLTEFRFDGLRLDAVHTIRDDGDPPILAELANVVRAACPGRAIHLVVENDANGAALLMRDGDGRVGQYTAQWNDDIHHALHRLLTAEAGNYYRDYGPDPLPHLVRCLTDGFAFQGEASEHRQGQTRGEPSRDLPPQAFIAFLQNHDHIGNRALGERLDRLAPAEAVLAAQALLLLCPQIPMLFQGEEWAASTPFLYFCDLGRDWAQRVRDGRRHEFVHFPEFHGDGAARVPDPLAMDSFLRSKLDWDEASQPRHAGRRQTVRHLLEIRRREIMPRLAGMAAGWGEILGTQVIRVHWRLNDGSTLWVVANLSPEPAPGVVPGPGAILYSNNKGIGDFPAWGVAWTLEDGGSE